jgi:hypothetical protein
VVSLVTNLCRSLRAKVASITDVGFGVGWPRLRNQSFQTIIAQIPPNPDMDDSAVWFPHLSGIITVQSA